MSIQCITADVWIEEDLVDYLDRYVVLAFVLSLILSIIFVIALVRYITSQQKRQREKDISIRERNLLPYKPKRDEDENESEDDEIWSNSDEETVDLQASFEVLNDNEDDEEELSEATQHSFETHYLKTGTSDTFQTDSEIMDCPYKDLMLELHNDHCNSLGIAVSPLSFLFLQINQKENKYLSNQLANSLHYLILYRQTTFHCLLNFVLEEFCKSHVISEDLRLYLQSKYDQILDECNSSNVIEKLIQTSSGIKCIAKQFVGDMEKYNQSDVKQLNNLRNMLQLFFEYHLDCIKLFASHLNDYANIHEKYQLGLYDCSIDCNKVFLNVKYRVLFFKSAVEKITKQQNILARYNTESSALFDVFANQLEAELKTVISTLNRTRVEEIEKLKAKHALDESNLKVEILETQDLKTKEKVGTFHQYLTVLSTEHEQARMNLLLDLVRFESKTVKQLFLKHQNAFMEQISELEESVISTLNQQNSLSEDQILEIAQEVQTRLKNLKEHHKIAKMEFLKTSEVAIHNQSNIVVVFCDFVMKQVSFEYKFCLNALSMVLKSLPSIQEEVKDNMISSLKENLSLVVFDLIINLLSNFLYTAYGKDYGEENNLQDIFSKIRSELNSNVFISEEYVTNNIQSSFKSVCEVNEIPLNELYIKYYSIINLVLHEKIIPLFEKEIENVLQETILTHHIDHLHVYKCIVELQRSLKDTHNSPSESKKQQYLSRKGSSFRQKRKDEEFVEEYESHLNMKKNKFETYYQQKEDALLKLSIKKKDKSLSLKDSCLNILSSQLDYVDLNTFETLQQLFDLEHYYMIERLLKKVSLFSDSNQDIQSSSTKKSVKLSRKEMRENSDDEVVEKTPRTSKSVYKKNKVTNDDDQSDHQKRSKSKLHHKNSVMPVARSVKVPQVKRLMSGRTATVSPDGTRKGKNNRNSKN